MLAFLSLCLGCATIRTTDPQQSATEQFLKSVAASKAVDQLQFDTLRDRKVYVDTQYLTAATQPSSEHSFLVGELREKLLVTGVRLMNNREEADIILEMRSGGMSIDRYEYLLGIPSTYVPQATTTGGGTAVPLNIPELAILKSTKQWGFASVAYVAYWRKTGEIITHSGPFVGKTKREDWWIFGYGPRTVGNIPPAEPNK